MYLDHAASAPVRREVLVAMTPHLTSEFGNPSSVHGAGERARAALDDARRRVARVVGARTHDVVFTSGGTEANNLGIKGIAVAAALARGARHVVTSAIEHSSVLGSARALERIHGFSSTVLPVDCHGLVDPDRVDAAIRDDTALVAVGYANNEVGTVQPILDIERVCERRGVPLHIDAVQAAGWLPLSFPRSSLAVSGHKIGTPKGTGALIAPARIPLEPLFHGGGQERGRRAGTESVAGAVALATALELAEAERASAARHVERIRDEFVARVLALVPGAVLTGHPSRRLPHIASFTIAGANGETVLTDLERRGVLASSGSACSSASEDASHVLLALGIDDDLARTAIRFSLAANGTELSSVASALADAVASHRGRSTDSVGSSL
ncbi:cysteine desulfurase [Microbacterium nanhaiense]|uniref:Cysteine desulfurase n=2 Tax=Microbacterium nanhaiense TaxID=1301026 RepID=A0ABQ2MV43_9MICO|nr:cysteine desulfurase [Microbacterium nanhaiense]